MSEAVWDEVVDGPEPVPLPELPYVPTLMDADVAPNDVAAWAATVTPGSATVKPLAALVPGRLSDAALVDALVAWEKHVAWAQAQQHKLLAIMATRPTAPGPLGRLDKQWVREDVAAALRLSGRAAADRLAFATELSRLPATLGVLHRGEISNLHARTLAEATVALDDRAAAAVESSVLPKAPGQALATFKRSLRKAVLTLAPKTAEDAHAEALTQRRVVRTPDGSGMSWVSMLLADAAAGTVMTAIDAIARRIPKTDPRTADQRRADAAVQIAIDVLHARDTARGAGIGMGTGMGIGSGPGTATGGRELPREHGMRPSVQVTVALSTLLGLDGQPGELDGTGPIPASVARRIVADQTGTWRRLVTDELGKLIDYGRRTYRPPKDLADYVIARDRTCRFPHCNRRAARCEIDHRRSWECGGATCAFNLDALCVRHHHAKHDADWTPRRLPNGDLEWTSPTGHRYVKDAATYPIDTTADPPERLESTDPPEPDPDPPYRLVHPHPRPANGVSHATQQPRHPRISQQSGDSVVFDHLDTSLNRPRRCAAGSVLPGRRV
jgi:hypothetical protein